MFLNEYWYMAGWPSEVGSKPLRRLILNEPIVLFRCSDGSVAALEDRCSHRNYPLSKGEIINDALQCGYHGLTFDRTGSCVYAPGQDRPPPRSDIRAYPIEERDGIIWIWMGMSEADYSLVPDLSWMNADNWLPFRDGYIHLKANHKGLAENLLDISHLAYVHKKSMGSDPDLIASGDIRVTIESFGVRRITTFTRMPTPPVYAASPLVGDQVDQRTESTMRPGLYQNHVAVKDSINGGDWKCAGSDGDYPIKNRSFHGIVPETESSTHYFFGGAALDSGVATMSGGQAMEILSEDVDVLESIEANEKLIGSRPVINLRNDLAVMRWRSFLEQINSGEREIAA